MLPKSNLKKAALAMAYSCSDQVIPVETAQSSVAADGTSASHARKGDTNTFNVAVGAPIEEVLNKMMRV